MSMAVEDSTVESAVLVLTYESYLAEGTINCRYEILDGVRH